MKYSRHAFRAGACDLGHQRLPTDTIFKPDRIAMMGAFRTKSVFPLYWGSLQSNLIGYCKMPQAQKSYTYQTPYRPPLIHKFHAEIIPHGQRKGDTVKLSYVSRKISKSEHFGGGEGSSPTNSCRTWSLTCPAMHARCSGACPEEASAEFTSTPFPTRKAATGLWQCSLAKNNALRSSYNKDGRRKPIAGGIK